MTHCSNYYTALSLSLSLFLSLFLSSVCLPAQPFEGIRNIFLSEMEIAVEVKEENWVILVFLYLWPSLEGGQHETGDSIAWRWPWLKISTQNHWGECREMERDREDYQTLQIDILRYRKSKSGSRTNLQRMQYFSKLKHLTSLTINKMDVESN